MQGLYAPIIHVPLRYALPSLGLGGLREMGRNGHSTMRAMPVRRGASQACWSPSPRIGCIRDCVRGVAWVRHFALFPCRRPRRSPSYGHSGRTRRTASRRRLQAGQLAVPRRGRRVRHRRGLLGHQRRMSTRREEHRAVAGGHRSVRPGRVLRRSSRRMFPRREEHGGVPPGSRALRCRRVVRRRRRGLSARQDRDGGHHLPGRRGRL